MTNININFEWLIEIFSNFYCFFVRIATGLQATPAWVLGEWEHGAWQWSFYNPFTGHSVLTSIDYSIIGDGFMSLLVRLGYGGTPLWAAFLALTSTFFFILLVAKVITSAFD